ncbi:unnamed protein product [Withania somnifera]
MEGIHGTVFAYGVTSSGKTHTMHGDHNSPGIIPLAIKDVFSIIQDTPGREFLLRVSYIEIYNEVINDLLDPTGQNLRVREDAQGTYVEGIKEEVVLSPGHALSFIAAGEEHRHVGSNNFNLFSSRSHTIFSLMIESSAHGDEYDGVIFSQLNLIDLAGSESSKTETTGLRRKEGSYINKSLLTLGTVIGKLSEGKACHVPYRDSKLTRLLQSSLSGHGHVSLICTVTPASSNMEETHNTLKFASRAKRVEIYASRNQLEEGQVKMQSRLEEEEEEKAALLSRIQRLTKLILVSSKNSIPGNSGDVAAQQRSFSAFEDDKMDSSMVTDSENQKDPSSDSSDLKHKRSSSKWNDDISQAGSTITELTEMGELLGGSSCGSKLPREDISVSDEMDLLAEQVKMLSGEIAFSSSTLKRLMEQSVNDPESSRNQMENLEREIQEKRNQMRILEQRIVEKGEASVSKASLVEMQQTLMKLMTQYSQTGFELEIKSADNRILQEELQNKCSENKELQEKIYHLEQQLVAVRAGKSYPSSERVSAEYVGELRKKIQSQDIENGKLKLEHVQIVEENSGLHVQNQKLSEEALYAKELASAAAVELKNLAGEVTKLSLQNVKLEKELLAAREMLNSRSSIARTGNVGNRKHGENLQPGRSGWISGRGSEIPGEIHDDFDTWDLDPEDLKMELQARKQREEALEAVLGEKEVVEDDYRKMVEEGKEREAALENDLANMWVLVAQLKRETGARQDSKLAAERQNVEERLNDVKINDINPKERLNDVKINDINPKELILSDNLSVNAIAEIPKEEPLVARLKARMQEMKEKEHRYLGNGDANSHVCKVCFESPTAAMLLPCLHLCLCKSCSLACFECPICRTKIVDRSFTFT